MNEPERDQLTIQRDGLLKKKRLIDAVDKLRQKSRPDQKEFQTDLSYLCDEIGENMWTPTMDLLGSVSDKDVVLFDIKEEHVGGDPWGYRSVTTTIGKDFDEFARKLREKYHELNKKLGRQPRDESNNEEKWVRYTSLYYVLVKRLLPAIWKFLLVVYERTIAGLVRGLSK